MASLKQQVQTVHMEAKKMESDLSLKSKAVDQLQGYMSELQEVKEKNETLKDENIQLITQLEE